MKINVDRHLGWCTLPLVPSSPLTIQEIPIELPTFTCKVCGYSWHPMKPKVPLRCAGCKTPYWFRDQVAGKTLQPSNRKPKAGNKKG